MATVKELILIQIQAVDPVNVTQMHCWIVEQHVAEAGQHDLTDNEYERSLAIEAALQELLDEKLIEIELQDSNVEFRQRIVSI